MSYLLFVDESGNDKAESPYEVLAGLAVQDQQLWSLICRLQDAEVEHFGQRVSKGSVELKAKRLLKRKTYTLAKQLPPIENPLRRELAHSCLVKGAEARAASLSASRVTRAELTALAQAKLAFVQTALELCGQHQVKVFASIIPRSAPRPSGNFLRKDYAYLFERFFYFVEDRSTAELGLVVFDELDQTRCHLLLEQMSLYFLRTSKGRLRAARIIPEPFFVRSELSTMVQIADLVAYLISWGVRFGAMQGDARTELDPLASLVLEMRHRTIRDLPGRPSSPVWSFTVIDDLRPQLEREENKKGNADELAKPPKEE